MKKFLLVLLVLCISLVPLVTFSACGKKDKDDTDVVILKYTVTFVGGEGATGTVPTMTDKRQGQKFYLPGQGTLEKEGYLFIGWNDGINTYEADSRYTMPKKDVIFTAVWELPPELFSVTFDGGDATGGYVPTIEDKLEGDFFEMPPANTLQYPGYYFTGWLCDLDESTYNSGSPFTMPANNVTFTALWQGVPYYVSYNGNDSETGEMGQSAHIYGEESYLTANDFVREGYIFAGWAYFASDDVNDIVYSDSALLTDNIRNSNNEIPNLEEIIELYAVWIEETTHTMTFTAGEGEGDQFTLYVKDGDDLTFPESSFTRTGYTFVGWTTVGDETTYYPEDTNFTPTDDVTFTAVWTANGYTVSYDGNGATDGSTASSSHTYDEAESLTANGFTRTGYTFAGWSTTALGTVEYDDEESVTNLTTVNGATVTLYAVWAENYTVTFVGGEGTTGTPPTTQTHVAGAEFELPDEGELEKTGYTFAGWNDGTTTYDAGAQFTIPASAVTFTAVWTANGYTVSYDGNGATDGSTASSSHTYDEAESLTANGFTRTGYTFAGWSTTALGTVEYDDEESVTNLTTVNGATVTLYAVWAENYTVTFVGGEGTTGTPPTTQTHVAGAEFELPDEGELEKTGYTFAGWNDGTTTYDAGAQFTIPASAVTFTAVWTANGYTVSYDGNGATDGSTASSSHTYDEAESLTANGFTRTGYTFAGWSTTALGTVEYDDEESVTNLTTVNGATVTLYAVWAENYTVTFVGGEGTTGTPPTTQTHVAGAEFELPDEGELEKTGYTFAGWLCDYDSQTYHPNDTAFTMPNENVTFTAVWE